MTLTADMLSVSIYADGADKASILKLAGNPKIRGFTTNPTLMRKAGITDYEAFARDILGCIDGRPVSFEVFSDDFDEMYSQARKIATWGGNIHVKIPVTNTAGDSAIPLIESLAHDKVQMNVTALFTDAQVEVNRRAADSAILQHFCLRRSHRRCRHRSASGHEARPGHHAAFPAADPDLGQPARSLQRCAGRHDWLPHHHDHAGPNRQALLSGPRPR